MSRVRGWCPSAHRPMRSSDGLIVRVRPRMARLSRARALLLCDLAVRYGNGMIDLTSRGNVQLRGVGEDAHPALLAELIAAGLAAADPSAELSMTVTPFPGADGITGTLVETLDGVARDLPDLPEKMGAVVDSGEQRWLSDVSGDFRLERGETGLILRADGCELGRPVSPESAGSAVREMAEWFVRTGGREAGRMRRHLQNATLPEEWQLVAPVAAASERVLPDPSRGRIGVAFGQLTAKSFSWLLDEVDADAVVITPWRLLILTDASGAAIDLRDALVSSPASDFVLDKSDPILRMTACPGALACSEASVETRAFARRISLQTTAEVHVTGCAKSCAKRSASPYTLVGRNGRFDIVREGTSLDPAILTAQTEEQVIAWLAAADDQHEHRHGQIPAET